VEQTTGRRIDPYQFPLDDAETFALLCRGETKGVFQLESGGIRDLLQRMKPDQLGDIIATNALYRPGPLEGGMIEDYIQVKHGRRQAEYKHPVMKEVLQETHGVMVYQEQVMRILNRLGGLALANAYSCIKAISKKKLDAIAKYREEFVAGAGRQGMAKKQAEEVFGLIEKFAGYGFNKSHSTAYALIAYMTAYLKAHQPMEFMAALLSSDIPGRNFKKKDALVEHIEDCQRMGIEMLPPDVNRSEVEFAPAGGKICYALSAIKGCGGRRRRPDPPRRRTLPQSVRLLRAARSRHRQPCRRRVAREGGGLRWDGRPPQPVLCRHRPGHAGRGRRRRRPPQRPDGTLRRRRRSAGRIRPQRPPRSSGMGPPRPPD
jgi:DNA polymerase-3 subunit alpha